MRTPVLLSLLGVLSLVAALGHLSSSYAQEQGQRYTAGQCPYESSKTFWTVAEDKNGVELTAKTDKADVDRLRESFRNLADRQNRMMAGASEREQGGQQGYGQGQRGQQGYGQGQRGQQGMQGGQQGGQQQGMQGGQQQGMRGEEQAYLTTVPSQVRYEKIKDGARLFITPKNMKQYTMLRNQIWEKAWQLSSGNCSVFQQTGSGAGGGGQ